MLTINTIYCLYLFVVTLKKYSYKRFDMYTDIHTYTNTFTYIYSGIHEFKAVTVAVALVTAFMLAFYSLQWWKRTKYIYSSTSMLV